MKKYLVLISYLLLPCIIFGIGLLLEINFNPVFLVVFYLITLVGIFLFFMFKFYRDKMKILALLLGLILSPLFAFIPEARAYYLDVVVLDGPWLSFHFFVSTLALVFYILPFLFVFIVALIMAITMDKKKELHDRNHVSKGNISKNVKKNHNKKANQMKHKKNSNK